MKNRQTFEVVFQNSKELKQVRRFVKSLHYIYDCISKRQKKVYMYVTKSYLSFSTDFTEIKTSQIYPAVCTLRKSHIIKTGGVNNVFQNKSIDEGYLYIIDSQSIIKFLNSHAEPDILHMSLILPIPEDNAEIAEMGLNYETVDGIETDCTIYTSLENSQNWPYTGGRINDQSCLFKKQQSFKFITLPPKFSKQIEYIKKYPDFWLSLQNEGIKVQRQQGGRIVSEQCIRTENSLEYNPHELVSYIQGNTFLGIKTAPFFHHLQFSNKQGRKCNTRLISVNSYFYNEMQKCYLVMETLTQKRQISEAFEIFPAKSMQGPNIQTSKTEKIAPRMINKETKKEENVLDQKIIINRFYGLQYEQEINQQITMRQGFISMPNKIQNVNPSVSKYKIQLD